MKIIFPDGTVLKPESATIVWENLDVPGENLGGKLHIKVNPDGIVRDVWVSRESGLDHNIGGDWATVYDLVHTLVEEGA